MASVVSDTKEWSEPLKRLGFKGNVTEKMNHLNEQEMYEAFAFLLGRYDESWNWNAKEKSNDGNAKKVMKYLRLMDLGYCARTLEEIKPNNKKMNRALGLIIEKLETKYGPNMYQKMRLKPMVFEKENKVVKTPLKTPVTNPALNRIQTGNQIPRTPPSVSRPPLGTIKASVTKDAPPEEVNPFVSRKALDRTPMKPASSSKLRPSEDDVQLIKTPAVMKTAAASGNSNVLKGLEKTLRTPVAPPQAPQPYSQVRDYSSKVKVQEDFIRNQVQKILKTPSNLGRRSDAHTITPLAKHSTMKAALKTPETLVEEDHVDENDALGTRGYVESAALVSEIEALKNEEIRLGRAVKTSGLEQEQLEYKAEQMKEQIEKATLEYQSTLALVKNMGLNVSSSDYKVVERELQEYHDQIREKLKTAQSLLASKSSHLSEKTSAINSEIERQLEEQARIRKEASLASQTLEHEIESLKEKLLACQEDSQDNVDALWALEEERTRKNHQLQEASNVSFSRANSRLRILVRRAEMYVQRHQTLKAVKRIVDTM
eukprot:Nk52_evm10s2578 gene=Nk52_evmTU10s2578